jgi:hypothetical protein
MKPTHGRKCITNTPASSEMKVKLDGTSGYEQSKNNNDVIALLTMI